jgi:hypothetical protein
MHVQASMQLYAQRKSIGAFSHLNHKKPQRKNVVDVKVCASCFQQCRLVALPSVTSAGDLCSRCKRKNVYSAVVVRF